MAKPPKKAAGKTSAAKTPAETGQALKRRILRAAKAKGDARAKAKAKAKPAGASQPYRPAVVTFLDILGFRQRVASSQDGTAIRRILSRLRSFADVNDPDEALEAGHGFEVTHAIAFSDSVVRIRFFDTEYSAGALYHEVLSLLHVQAEMMADDVLVRGGVTVGDVYLEGDMAFGPGFNRAYDLESQFANVPRIVIGPEAFVALRQDPRLVAVDHTPEEDIAYLRRLLKRGDDGFWFIDYLQAMRSELDHPEVHPDLVAQHRALIIGGAASAPAHSRVLQKYLWLAHYLNDAVERCGLPETLRLTQADIPALDALSDRPPWMAAGDDGDLD
jgi:hypothetical protein